MTCKDCIYEKMCESRYEREHCLSFKDKANFVEVVRCKDCKRCRVEHLRKEKGKESVGVYVCNGIGVVDRTFYCACGERREDK